MSAVQPGPPPAGEPLSALIARCATLAYVVHGTMNAVEEPDGCKVVPFPAKAPDANDIHRQLGTDAARALTDTLPDIEFEDKAKARGNGRLEVNSEAFARNRTQQGEQPPAPIVLHGFNPADWEGKKAPSRKSIVPDYIPDETVTLLYADGGTGKSYLKLQLAVARALAKEWIGLFPEPGRTLVLSTEDDLDEMWRRIEGMIEAETGPFAGARMADLGDIRLVDLVGENSVLGLLTKGIIEPTPMYAALDAYIAEFKPGLVELDVLADLFSGEENNRPQVTQFIGLLKRLCRKHHCATLLLAQPSVTGMNTGSGTSGSTGWSNSGRSRLYFQRVKTADGGEPNKNLRTFEGKKANYSEVGGKFDVEWKGGLFRRVGGSTGFDKAAAEQKADDVFLTLLKRFNAQNRNASDKPSKAYAPTQFAQEPDNQGISTKQFEAAMRRLFKAEKIHVLDKGRPSKPDRTLVPTESLLDGGK